MDLAGDGSDAVVYSNTPGYLFGIRRFMKKHRIDRKFMKTIEKLKNSGVDHILSFRWPFSVAYIKEDMLYVVDVSENRIYAENDYILQRILHDVYNGG